MTIQFFKFLGYLENFFAFLASHGNPDFARDWAIGEFAFVPIILKHRNWLASHLGAGALEDDLFDFRRDLENSCVFDK